MGKVCREKHGYATPDAQADWNAVHAALAPHLTDLNLPVDWDSSERRCANILVHRIAVEQNGHIAIACSNALLHVGFSKLAARVAARMAKIVLTDEGTEFTIRAPYAAEILAIPGRRWDGAAKVHRVYAPSELRARDVVKDRIYKALLAAFPGQLASGPKGIFVLE